MRAAAIGLCSLFLAGCAADSDPTSDVDLGEGAEAEVETTIHTVTPATIASLEPGEQLQVDLTNADHVWRFLPSGGPVDFTRVDLVCPNGNAMPMMDWLEERNSPLQVPFTTFSTRMFVVTEPGSSEAASGLVPGPCAVCQDCPDGAFLCFLSGACGPTEGNAGSSGDNQAASYLLHTGGYVGPH